MQSSAYIEKWDNVSQDQAKVGTHIKAAGIIANGKTSNYKSVTYSYLYLTEAVLIRLEGEKLEFPL